MGKIMGMLSVLLAGVIVFSVYMQVAVNSNTTGWSNLMVSSIQSYLPLLALVGIIIFIVTVSMSFGGKKS